MAKRKMNIWPLGIIVAIATFIGTIVVAMSFMMRDNVSLVSDDYYKQEIKYQARIDSEKRVVDNGRMPTFRYLSATDALEVILPNFQPEARTEGKLTFFRPSNPSKDFFLALQLSADGSQWVDLSKVDGGLWLVQLDWSENGETYYFEQELTL